MAWQGQAWAGAAWEASPELINPLGVRLYFRANETPTIATDFDSGWDDSTGMVSRVLSPLRFSWDTLTTSANKGWTAGTLLVDRQYISGPMVAGVVFDGSTVDCVIAGSERTALSNATPRLSVRVVSEDGATERVVLLAIHASATSEYTETTVESRYLANGAALANYTTVEGDRLVVEVGFGDALGTSPQARMAFGSSAASDHAAPPGEGSTAALNPWIEITPP